MSENIDLSCADWRKSRRSGSGNACVELARVPGVLAVRDSKNPDGPALTFDPRVAGSFLARVKRGQHDL